MKNLLLLGLFCFGIHCAEAQTFRVSSGYYFFKGGQPLLSQFSSYHGIGLNAEYQPAGKPVSFYTQVQGGSALLYHYYQTYNLNGGGEGRARIDAQRNVFRVNVGSRFYPAGTSKSFQPYLSVGLGYLGYNTSVTVSEDQFTEDDCAVAPGSSPERLFRSSAINGEGALGFMIDYTRLFNKNVQEYGLYSDISLGYTVGSLVEIADISQYHPSHHSDEASAVTFTFRDRRTGIEHRHSVASLEKGMASFMTLHVGIGLRF